MDQDTLRSLLREAVRETVTEVPAFLKPYARRLVDVGEVAVALYGAGVSQRKAAEAFRRRLLPEEMAFVYLDGLSLKVFREGEGIVRETVYVAVGVTPGGERRVLGFWLLPTESALGWEGVLRELWQKGLRVLLFVTDGLPGLPEAIRRVYPQAEWQVRGARGAVEPVPGAGQGPGPSGRGPEAGVRGGESGRGPAGP